MKYEITGPNPGPFILFLNVDQPYFRASRLVVVNGLPGFAFTQFYMEGQWSDLAIVLILSIMKVSGRPWVLLKHSADAYGPSFSVSY